jgi:hypothetical protein
MTLEEFDRGYWYAVELKRFAVSIGVRRVSALRKDELEVLIRRFLKSGRVPPSPKRRAPKTAIKDVARGLTRRLRVETYTNDPETKAFIEREAKRANPDFSKRSGAMYRLNRWRESQLAEGRRLTYGELVDEYVRLCAETTAFERVPLACYIYFMSDYLAAEPGATREDAIRAWHELKAMDIPKDYASWRKVR